MAKKIAVLFLFLIIECSTFSEYVKDFFGQVVTCSLDACETDESECENENQDKKSEPNKYLMSFLGLNFTFKYFSSKKNIYFFTQSSARFPIRLIQSPPPKV